MPIMTGVPGSQGARLYSIPVGKPQKLWKVPRPWGKG